MVVALLRYISGTHKPSVSAVISLVISILEYQLIFSIDTPSPLQS